MQDIREVDEHVRYVRIYFQRGRHQSVRFAHLTVLGFDETEKMQRVEILGRSLDHTRVKLFSFAQLSLLVKAQRFLQNMRDIEGS